MHTQVHCGQSSPGNPQPWAGETQGLLRFEGRENQRELSSEKPLPSFGDREGEMMRGSEKKEGNRERRAGKRLRMKEESTDGSRAEGAGEGGRDGVGRQGNRNERTEGNGGTDRLLRIGQEGRREKKKKKHRRRLTARKRT